MPSEISSESAYNIINSLVEIEEKQHRTSWSDKGHDFINGWVEK